MCPVCLASVGMIVAGATSAGGLTALAVKRSREMERVPTGDTKDNPKSEFLRLQLRSDSIKENVMNIANKSVLITGANRGIGQALVNEAIRRGAKRVFAGTRGALQHADKRVTPLTLDVTNASQIQRAAEEVDTPRRPHQQRRRRDLRRSEQSGRDRAAPGCQPPRSAQSDARVLAAAETLERR